MQSISLLVITKFLFLTTGYHLMMLRFIMKDVTVIIYKIYQLKYRSKDIEPQHDKTRKCTTIQPIMNGRVNTYQKTAFSNTSTSLHDKQHTPIFSSRGCFTGGNLD